MYLAFYLENHRMPDVSEMNDICKRLFATVQALAPKTEYEEFYKVVEKRVLGYESRILKDIKDGITIETLNTKKQRKAPEEKTAVAKQKKQQKRAKRKKEARDNLTKEEILQDDRFSLLPVIPPEVQGIAAKRKPAKVIDFSQYIENNRGTNN